jgi:O-antigen ligase
MIPALGVLFPLYVTALHCSIAAMEIVGWLIFALALGLLYQHRADVKPSHFDKKVAALLIMFTVWVGISCLAAPLTKGFWFQFGFMRWIFLLMGFAFALSRAWSIKFEDRLVKTWTIVFLISTLYGGLQFFTGIDFIREGKVQAELGGLYKATGFLSFSLTYAYMTGLSHFALFFPFQKKFGVKASYALAAIGVLGLAAGSSRGSWLAAIACAIVYLLFEKRKWLIPFVIAVVVAVAGLSTLKDVIGAKVADMAQLKMDHSSSVRVDIWRAYFAMFKDHPMTGIGIFEGDKRLPEYYAKLGIDQPFVSHAHNNYLQFLAGTGLPGFLLYIWVIVLFLYMAWQIRKETPWGWSLFLGQLFIHLGGFTECNFIDGEITHFLIFTWALTWMLYSRRGERQIAPSALRSRG